MTEPTLEEQIEYAKYLCEGDESLAVQRAILASLERLRDIDKRLDAQTVPVEPDEVATLIGGSWSELNAEGTRKYIDSLQSALQRAQEERDKSNAEWGAAHNLQMKRAESAESLNKRMVELMKEPSEGMVDAAEKADREYTDRQYGKEHPLMQQGSYDHWKAMSAELLKEVGE